MIRIVGTLKTRSDTNGLDEICVQLGKNAPCKTPTTIGKSSLVELGRWLDDRLTLLDRELNAVADGSDIETKEQDFEKV